VSCDDVCLRLPVLINCCRHVFQARLVSTQYKALTDEEKQKYEGMASADKERYAKEMKGYTPPEGAGKEGKASKGGKAGKGAKPGMLEWPRSPSGFWAPISYCVCPLALQGKRKIPTPPNDPPLRLFFSRI
jgi:HMG (high mobility group) box